MGDNHRRNHCNLSIEAIHWLSGELLGDGSLRKISCHSALFHYGSQYKEYAEYVRDTLKSFGIEQAGKINKHKHKKFKTINYQYASLAYPELLTIHKKWYPKGKKIVPRDIVLTPLVLRQWYIGDGSLVKPKKGKPSIILCTCGFTVYDVNWLMKQLRHLGYWAIRQKSINTIRISSCHSNKTVNDFLNYIGECPVECYKYKWDIVTTIKRI